jgi:hypothetical protein
MKITQMLKRFAVLTSALAVFAVSASANPMHKNTQRSHHRVQTHYQVGLIGFSSNNANQQNSEENNTYQPERSPGFDEYLH